MIVLAQVDFKKKRSVLVVVVVVVVIVGPVNRYLSREKHVCVCLIKNFQNGRSDDKSSSRENTQSV